MDTKMLLLMGIGSVLILIAGWILLFVHHRLSQKRQKRLLQTLESKIIPLVREEMICATMECMDIMPSKIVSARELLETFDRQV